MAVRVAALEERVTNLEAQCRQTDETAAAAGAAHKHNTRLLMALRETQVEHGQLLVGHGQRLDAIDAKLAEHGQLLVEHGQLLVGHGQRLDAIDAKLAEHDRRFDAINARFTAVDARFDALDTEIASIKGTLGRVAVGMYAIEKLIRRIAPDDIGADDTGAVAGT